MTVTDQSSTRKQQPEDSHHREAKLSQRKVQRGEKSQMESQRMEL